MTTGAAASTSRGATITSGVRGGQPHLGYGVGPGAYVRQGYGQAPFSNGVAHGYQEAGQYQYGAAPQQVQSAVPGHSISCSNLIVRVGVT